MVEQGSTLVAAAEAFGVSVRCARKWVARYRVAGEAGLVDRSSAPRRVANRTPAERVAVILGLRGLRMTAAEIAETIGMPLSTVSVALKRNGVQLGRIGLEQAVRYERSRPGELLRPQLGRRHFLRVTDRPLVSPRRLRPLVGRKNLLWSSPSIGPVNAVAMWMRSPGHRANILDPRWRDIGIAAVHISAGTGAFRRMPVTIVTTDFGVRR